MKNWQSFFRSRNLERILDGNNCPVARMRLFSQGIQTNNRIFLYESITGDKGCLACGNCIDACPVVREKKRFVFTQNQRTSMALENIVNEECRRCYACVRACPQVSKPTKEFVMGFRRVEKFIHAFTAVQSSDAALLCGYFTAVDPGLVLPAGPFPFQKSRGQQLPFRSRGYCLGKGFLALLKKSATSSTT